MSKVYNLSSNLFKIDFSFPHENIDKFYQSFLSTSIGKIYQSIPWAQLNRIFKKDKKPQGLKPIFDTQGRIALMLLKSYTGYSDKKLIERLNGDYHLQLFCGIYLRPGERLVDYKIVSKIRTALSCKMDIVKMQEVLACHWKPYMEELNLMLTDATCYESYLRYPTTVKLLWECCDWLYHQQKLMCKSVKLRLPRNKYGEQKTKFLNYQRSRKKTHKQTQKRIGSLLYLQKKLMDQTALIEQQSVSTMPGRYYERKKIIDQIYEQQELYYRTGERSKSMIVSIDKSYIRPIVRGKENKAVEFGAKVNMIQVNGLNFIEHLSFEAFHEGNRLESSVRLSENLFHTRCTHTAGDAIYATNANRSYCRRKGITTSFVRKGKGGKDEQHRKQMQVILSKERASRMEGSFGVEKNHYSLRKVKARTKNNEILWIVFGVHTANAARISERIFKEDEIPIKQAA